MPAELIQAGGKTLYSELHKFIFFNMEELTWQWKESNIVHISKMGYASDCELHTKLYPTLFSQG